MSKEFIMGKVKIKFEDDFDIVDGRYRKIILTADQEIQYREARKEDRMMWQGGGFGVRGAISGALKAEAMNMATGAAHSLFNSIGNAKTTAKANAEKEELFKELSTVNDLADGVRKNVFFIHFALVDALRKNGNVDVAEYISQEGQDKSREFSIT